VNKTIQALKVIFGYAVAASYVTRNPAAAVKAMKLGTASEVTAEQVPSAEEASKLIEMASGLGRVFCMTAAYTGRGKGSCWPSSGMTSTWTPER